MIAVERDAIKPDPITAITRDHGDHGSPSMPDLLAALNQARHQFLEARRRYFKLRELVSLRRIQEQDRLQKLEELARRCPPRQEDANANHTEADADAERSYLNQQLTDSILCLRKLKEFLLVRLTILCRRQRAVRRRAGAEAVKQWRQTPEVRDKLAEVRTLQNLIKSCELLRLCKLNALNRYDETRAPAAKRRPEDDLAAHAGRQEPADFAGAQDRAPRGPPETDG